MAEEKKHPGGGPGGTKGGGHPGGHPGGKPAGAGGGGHPGGRPGGPPAMDIDIEALVDITEKGAVVDGKKQEIDDRLYVQLLAYTGCNDSKVAVEALKKSGLEHIVLYDNINDPNGIAVVSMSNDPDFFVTDLREVLNKEPFKSLTPQPEYTMLGRTYSIGHEQDLEDWLITRVPRITANPEEPWAVWYPLRRKGEFALLDKKEQGKIMMEHGTIGRAFGMEGFAKDVRLACAGLDINDNDFVIGLIGDKLYPMSKLVETMRITKQTSTHMQSIGPFWIGRAVYQSDAK